MHAGVWLGARNTHITEKRKTFLPQTLLHRPITQEELNHITQCAPTAEKLARELMTKLFSKREMPYGNCTDTKGRWNILNRDVLAAIKGKYLIEHSLLGIIV